MLKILCCLVFSLVVVPSFAQPKILFSKKSNSFLQERKFFQTNRSGLPMQRQQKRIAAKEQAPMVFINKNKKATLDSLAQTLKGMGVRPTFDDDGVLHIKEFQTRRSTSKISLKGNLQEKKLLQDLLLPRLDEQFSLFSVDTEFVQIENTKRAYRFTLNFQRVFLNRIVRSTENFLQIDVDSTGNVVEIKISMEDFRPTAQLVDCSETYSENKVALDSIVKENFSNVSIMGDETTSFSIDSISVSGIAEAYCEINAFLFPCLSYSAEFTFSNKKKGWDIIDSPHSLKSWRKFKGAQTLVQGEF